MSVRVRYAPSPTGLQHIGGVRTALFNYFLAKASGGSFFLRLEDTDQERYDERAVQDLYDTFTWLGIKLDEGPREGGQYGPYIQSERLELYHQQAQNLIQTGRAYYCFCTAAELETRRAARTTLGLPPGYDRHCRALDPIESAKRAASGESHVIRFAVPLEGQISFHDELLGEVTWPNKDIIADPVLLKTDGFPTYHLAHPVDDHYMATSHVLRGQEWLPSTPLHVLLFRAFSWPVPRYCHLSVIMGPDGQKLSKRHGSTSAQEFRQAGYLPEAIINYVSLLGWSLDDKTEIFSAENLCRVFSLEKLSKNPATFDYQKLDWFNGYWIRQLTDERLSELLLPWLLQAGLVSPDQPSQKKAIAMLLAALPIAKERIHKLSDAAAVLGFLFQAPALTNPEHFIPKKQTAVEVATILERLLVELPQLPTRSDADNEAYFQALAEQWTIKLGSLLMPLRLAITGTAASPPLMSSIGLIGIAEATRRVQATIKLLRSELLKI
jgi:glutamyl-tRNA synthetase